MASNRLGWLCSSHDRLSSWALNSSPTTDSTPSSNSISTISIYHNTSISLSISISFSSWDCAHSCRMVSSEHEHGSPTSMNRTGDENRRWYLDPGLHGPRARQHRDELQRQQQQQKQQQRQQQQQELRVQWHRARPQADAADQIRGWAGADVI